MKATAPVCGFSADTEILTRHGWMTFDQLTCMDEVATRSADGRFEWQYPERITWQPYEGEMVWFHSRTTDMLVAPGHPVLCYKMSRPHQIGTKVELERDERTIPASSFSGRSRATLVAVSRWEPSTVRTDIAFVPSSRGKNGKRSPGRPPLAFQAPMSDFAAFMGMYLSEGFLSNPGGGEYPISICQTRAGKGFWEYQELLNRLVGRQVPWQSAGSGVWCFRNKALYEYLETCGKYAWGKRIPADVLDMPVEHLETFWRYYWLGDGSLMGSPGRKDIESIPTTSAQIADGLQEILQKLGCWSPVQRVKTGYAANYGATARPLYRVVRRAGDVACARKVEAAPYSGMIGSVRVPNPAVYVRRSRHPVWSGSA